MAPVINRAGTTVVYETLYKDGSQRQLFSLDLETGAQNFLWIDPEVEFPGLPLPRGYSGISLHFFQSPNPPMQIPLFGASIDDAGKTATILVRDETSAPRQSLVLIRLDGSGYTKIACAPEGFLEAVLSGDGKLAYAVTQSGRMLRVETESGATRELLPRTAWIGEVVGSAQNGSRNRIFGGGFARSRHMSPDPDGVTELGGIRVEYNGQAMPLFQVAPTEIVFRIPLDFDTENKGFGPRVVAPVESPFAPTPIRRVVDTFNWVVEPPGLTHEEGERITLHRPARPGEVVRFQATGSDASQTVLTCYINPIQDYVSTPDLDVDLLSLGPVADSPGLFEFRLRMPDEIATQSAHTGFLWCREPDRPGLPTRLVRVALAMNR